MHFGVGYDVPNQPGGEEPVIRNGEPRQVALGGRACVPPATDHAGQAGVEVRPAQRRRRLQLHGRSHFPEQPVAALRHRLGDHFRSRTGVEHGDDDPIARAGGELLDETAVVEVQVPRPRRRRLRLGPGAALREAFGPRDEPVGRRRQHPHRLSDAQPLAVKVDQVDDLGHQPRLVRIGQLEVVQRDDGTIRPASRQRKGRCGQAHSVGPDLQRRERFGSGGEVLAQHLRSDIASEDAVGDLPAIQRQLSHRLVQAHADALVAALGSARGGFHHQADFAGLEAHRYAPATRVVPRRHFPTFHRHSDLTPPRHTQSPPSVADDLERRPEIRQPIPLMEQSELGQAQGLGDGSPAAELAVEPAHQRRRGLVFHPPETLNQRGRSA